jgi:hypothetical protein
MLKGNCDRERRSVVTIAVVSALTFFGLSEPVSAQFNSGSTGANGALDYSDLPPGTVVIFDPTKLTPPAPRGTHVFNFTTINIPAGITVKLRGDMVNAPVYWLAQGDVAIAGTVDLDGQPGAGAAMILGARKRPLPGAGGYSGGVGGKFELALLPNQPIARAGDGPSGGAASKPAPYPNCTGSTGAGGGYSGNQFLVPLIGGSGGGGGNIEANSGALSSTPYASGGGAGGGAILIASSTSIAINGLITANGGAGGAALGFCNNRADQPLGSGGGGGGGAVRLAANTVSGNGTLRALGGTSQTTPGTPGAIRLEAFADDFVGGFSGTPASFGSPFGTFITSAPTVTVVSVDGIDVADPPTGNLSTPDVSINASGPVTLTIRAAGVPPGTVVTLQVFSDNNSDQTVQTTPLVGTMELSSASATVTFPSGFSLNYVKAKWTQ